MHKQYTTDDIAAETLARLDDIIASRQRGTPRRLPALPSRTPALVGSDIAAAATLRGVIGGPVTPQKQRGVIRIKRKAKAKAKRPFDFTKAPPSWADLT